MPVQVCVAGVVLKVIFGANPTSVEVMLWLSWSCDNNFIRKQYSKTISQVTTKNQNTKISNSDKIREDIISTRWA